ncbi:MAG: terminase TerL endonuclease subunit [Chloroflexota bacterium]
MGLRFTAEQYIDDVLSGKVVACRWVRLACERHRRDLELGHERGLYFDKRKAMVVIAFFSILRHSKGEWAGRPVLLEPWQQAHLWILFGWQRQDGTRRFRTSYMEVARKNGKSTIAAGVGLYLLVADGEPGAEVYTAATKRKQARIIHQEAIRMVRQSQELRQELQIHVDNIYSRTNYSKYEPLGRDSETEDGLNVHGALVDELHAHKTGGMWDVLETATGSRRQPLMYAITTAGTNRQTICFQMHDYTKKVLEGTVEDDAHYGIIYSLDREAGEGVSEGDIEDWTDEACWIKANPNLGVSKKLDNLQDKATKAKEMPGRRSVFQQKELNIWVQAAGRWILPERWRACDLGPVDMGRLKKRPFWGGLDLASTLDLTAWVLVFDPDEEGVRPLLARFWLPEDNLMARVKNDRVPYDVWVDQGYIELTPGNVVDYDFILAQVEEDMAEFENKELAFDPWNATHVSNKLGEKGATMVEFRQGFVSMNPAVKSLEVAIQKRTINHMGNPVLTWMADNVIMVSDPAGNQKPDKSKSIEKIDGIVALLMGHQRAVLAGGGTTASVYEERGLMGI